MSIHMLLAALLLAPISRPADDAIGLEPVWSHALGSAYSRVAADDELVVTQYGDGENDYVVAFAPGDGSVLWKCRVDDVYRGHDGSSDGGISTPVIGSKLVFAIGARGKLLALDRRTGEPRWSKHLVNDLGAEEPEYGFTSTPVLEGDVLVVQAGGSDGKNLCGFDANTGELRWSLSDGDAGYASPVVLELLGKRQLVVMNGGELLGVDPSDGELLWRHALGERENASMGRPGAIDDARFFAKISGQLTIFELAEADGGFALNELVRSREFNSTYSVPVYFEGYLYGFTSTFLTCVDVETGRRVWKSRPPGGHGLTLVDDRLVVFGAEGNIVVVRATPDGYAEEGRCAAFEHSGYSWPTVRDGRVFVRNETDIASLALVRADTSSVASTASDAAVGEHAFGAFVASLANAPDASARIAAFVDEQESFPLVDGEFVHFVYVGEAEDVAIVGSMTGGRAAESLARVPGTNFFHRTYRLEPGARWEYGFQVDFGRPGVDPRNPRTVPGRRGPSSDVAAPDYAAAKHLAEPTGARGTLVELEYTSEQLGNTRALSVYLPAGYDATASARYPLVLVHDGPEWLEKGLMRNTLDNVMTGHSVKPSVVVFIAPLDEWWFEAGGSRTEEYVRMLATELVPFLSETYAVSDRASDHVVAGLRGFGLTSALAVATYPDVFGAAAIQSVSLEDVARHALFARLQAAPPKDVKFFVGWNRYEMRDPDLGLDLREHSERLVAALEGAGCKVVKSEANGSHGWAGWRAQSGEWLSALLHAW